MPAVNAEVAVVPMSEIGITPSPQQPSEQTATIAAVSAQTLTAPAIIGAVSIPAMDAP